MMKAEGLLAGPVTRIVATNPEDARQTRYDENCALPSDIENRIKG